MVRHQGKSWGAAMFQTEELAEAMGPLLNPALIY